MALVQAKCTNCGANIEVNPQTEAGICPYCQTAYITQKAIVNYNTTIINNNTINTDTVNILGGNYENLMKIAMESWNGRDFEGAYQNFTKALEIEPDSEEALLYRSLCLGWKERHTNYQMILNTYHKVFDKINFDTADSEQVKRLNYFLNELDSLTSATVNNIYQQYRPDIYDTTENIKYVWSGLEDGIFVQREILVFSDKIVNKSDECKNSHINYMKRLLDYYQIICRKWKYLMPLDYRYHRTIYYPKKEEYEQEIINLEAKIREYQPDFGVKVKKTYSSTQKLFIGSCILSPVSFILSFLLVSFLPFSLTGTIIAGLLSLAALVINIFILRRFKTIDKKIVLTTIIFLIANVYSFIFLIANLFI